jgi:hypothetical protein
MRTSITLDEDVYHLASLYADGNGITLGAAIGELVREGHAARLAAPSRLKTLANGLRVMPSRGREITAEMVRKYQEDPIEKHQTPARRERADRSHRQRTRTPPEGRELVQNART